MLYQRNDVSRIENVQRNRRLPQKPEPFVNKVQVEHFIVIIVGAGESDLVDGSN